MQTPLVSILTPFKNTQQFLPDCLKSILNQTYHNWELIAIDDHSTDHSCQLVNNYALKDNRIKVAKNKGHGIISALRLAFSLSSGSYITRMDSDDIMKDNKLEVLLTSLINHGKKHVAIGQVKYFSSTGISNGYARYEAWLNGLTATGHNYSEIYKECVIPSPSWMLHKDDFLACEGFNPNRYPEDYDLTFRCYQAGFKCIPCNTVLHLWRDYSYRTSRTHEHYAQNYFLDIKLRYFLKLDHVKHRPLTVWGAGFKGKTIAKKLKKAQLPFYWICNNPKKIGKQIYGIRLRDFRYLTRLQQPQSIVTVANEKAQQTIKTYFESQQMKPMIDYFFFC